MAVLQSINHIFLRFPPTLRLHIMARRKAALFSTAIKWNSDEL